MLSLFNQLRELSKEMDFIFFVSTNNIEKFDHTIKRTGRFNSILPIGPLDRFTKDLFLKKLRINSEKNFSDIILT